MEFVLVTMLLSPFNPLYCFFMALMINSRHLFYGLSMLEKYKNTGLKKFYLIFGMCDESFAINCNTVIPKGIDKGCFMVCVNLLNQIYWVAGATIGGLLGNICKSIPKAWTLPSSLSSRQFSSANGNRQKIILLLF